MKERTYEALGLVENYFCAVIEQEAHGDVVPSRTEELHHAVEGLEGIAFCKYKKWLKHHMMESMDSTTTVTTASMAMPMATSYKH